MTAADDTTPPPAAPAPASSASGGGFPWIYVLAVFCGAALVFMVQPMVAKLVLPLLGGSPQVWNTSMVFFQGALLVGYGYAHFLQKVPAARTQVLIHLGVMVVAALLLPLRITGLFGEPNPTSPAMWLLGVLIVSIGAPFAALSATAPLVQAWHAKVHGRAGGPEPWALYAASNLGSLLALLAYPVIFEPTLTLHDQRWGWSLGYGLFVVIMAVLAVNIRRQPVEASAGAAESGPATGEAPPVTWRNRLTWIALAALPSSLMLGVTTHLTTDVASAPFLWVAPLALYLLTFIIAFQTRPLIPPRLTLILGSTALIICIATTPFGSANVAVTLGIHLVTFFLAALICHQALVARRPDPARLTDFYLCMSVGGVVGGAFNALIAPVVFETVVEYAAVLALIGLVRPWSGRLGRIEIYALAAAAIGAVLAMISVTDAFWTFMAEQGVSPKNPVFVTSAVGLVAIAVAAVATRERALPFFACLVMLAVTAETVGDRVAVYESKRSFFGVVQLTRSTEPRLGGEVRAFRHGTTLHGAQAQNEAYRCRPLTYYAPETAIGQVFTEIQRQRPSINVAAVGLGTGAVAAYVRASDRMTFFEIDPLVIEIASDPKVFSYTTECARGPVNYVVGDARLTLSKMPEGQYDILLIDAFSSDAIPAHLLTVEAVRGYLARIKPNGIVILHLSNRHLELLFPAASVVQAAGGQALFQSYQVPPDTPNYWESSEDVMIVARNPEALRAFKLDSRWGPAPPATVKPWTDDYTNLVGALVANFDGRRNTWMARTGQ
ncbi:MAG: fused MFS/spermidine synthase [Caulobacter sp.]